jgi:hypothetical protein
MSRAANGCLQPDDHRRIARLMQLHKQTHPDRIGQAFHVTGEYVRQIWSDLPQSDQAEIDDVIGMLR